MPVHLRLQCEDRFVAKARYVFSTFAKVLGLKLVLDDDSMDIPAGVVVWYGAASESPPSFPGLICIDAAVEAPAFFAAGRARSASGVNITYWEGEPVPFLFGRGQEGQQQRAQNELFFRDEAGAVRMPYDLVASAFYFLSCWEEQVIAERDQHGRFPYAHSLAAQLDLPQNVVDLYLDLFIALLNLARPERQPPITIPTWEKGAPFVACLTHDIDEIRKSTLSRLKFTAVHLLHPAAGHRHVPLSQRARFALATLFSRQDPYWTFPAFPKMERQYGFTASYFFQAASNGSNPYYSLSEPQIQNFIGELLAGGFEVGLHGTYQAAFDEERFLQEKAALRAVTNEEPAGHRQHYLRMEYATTLPIYERAGLRYDATLGYAEQEGYRNQFSYPYYPYNHAADRPYSFLELPTVIMDTTLAVYRGLPATQAWAVIERRLACACVRRGCITLLWHNLWDGLFPGYFDLYPRMLAWIHEHGGAGLAGGDVLSQWLAR